MFMHFRINFAIIGCYVQGPDRMSLKLIPRIQIELWRESLHSVVNHWNTVTPKYQNNSLKVTMFTQVGINFAINIGCYVQGA
jgi:hypothetical protein